MKNNIPIKKETVDKILKQMPFSDIGDASIREIVKLANTIEDETGVKFFRMEMGVPGLDVSEIALEAEIKAFKDGFASKYAPIEGVKPLKNEISSCNSGNRRTRCCIFGKSFKYSSRTKRPKVSRNRKPRHEPKGRFGKLLCKGWKFLLACHR